MHPTFVALSATLAAVLLVTGPAKVLGAGWTTAAAQHLGYSARAFRRIGLLETAAVAGLLAGLAWTPLNTAAAAGTAVLLTGAALAHRRAGDAVRRLLPPVWLALLAVATAVLGVAG